MDDGGWRTADVRGLCRPPPSSAVRARSHASRFSLFVFRFSFPAMIPFARRKRRNRDFRPRRPPASLAFLGVENLTVIGPEIEMNLKFDTTPAAPLAGVAGADPAKWSARYQGQRYVPKLVADVVFDTVYLQMTPAGAEAGADEISYANAPSDVSDVLGRFLSAFAGFPL